MVERLGNDAGYMRHPSAGEALGVVKTLEAVQRITEGAAGEEVAPPVNRQRAVVPDVAG